MTNRARPTAYIEPRLINEVDAARYLGRGRTLMIARNAAERAVSGEIMDIRAGEK